MRIKNGLPCRVAIHVADPYVAGVYTLIWEMRDGFRELGVHCDITTSSKSGKTTVRWGKEGGGSLWWTKRPDVCVKHSALTELFDSYDLVILGDLRFVRSDQAALKEGITPAYVDAVEHTRTLTTTLSHGVAYNDKSAVFMDRVINAGNFTKTLLYTDAPYNTKEHPVFKSFDVHIRTERMYRRRGFLSHTDPSPAVRPVDVMTLGRFGTGKNLHLPMLAVPHLRPNRTVRAEVWGACAAMMTETPSWALYDVLRSREGSRVDQEPTTDTGSVEYHSSPWSVQTREGHIISYGGPYTDSKILQRAGLFVNATRHGFSAGMEYTTLEAMDAGCNIIVPAGLKIPGGRYAMMNVHDDMKARATARGSAVHDTELIKSIAKHIDTMLGWGDRERLEQSQHNLRALEKFHDPKTVVRDTMNTFMYFNG